MAFKKKIAVLLCIQLLLVNCRAQSVLMSEEKKTVSTGQNEEKEEFAIAILPDTQYYTSERHGGKPEMFTAQTEWIVENAAKENIAYVIHLGDISDSGEKDPQEWVYAAEAMYKLDKPQPGYPQGIPYGLAVGNHDQTKSQYPLSGKTDQYNQYFGVEHFKDKDYYGGHYRDDNDSHFDLFTAAGTDFIVIYFEYDSYDEDIENQNDWACGLLEEYKERKAILVNHYTLSNNQRTGTNEKGFPRFGKQGQRIFDRVKRYPNVFMMLGGHIGANGEGYRQDGYAGKIMRSYLSDYQSRENGGNGLMRLMKFSKNDDLIKISTFSPYTGEQERDGDSEFTVPWLHHTNVARYLDFTNDQTTEVVFFSNGKWTIDHHVETFGREGDIAVPADYNGDGKAEVAVFRPAEGKFYVENGKEVFLGKLGDVPVCGDYDGDGFADFAVYRPSTMTWYFDGLDSVKFGAKNGIPVPADYDGDGIMDIGIFRTDNSFWQTSLGNIPLQLQHVPGDIPVPGDYNGDGKAEMALFRPSTGEWIIDKTEQIIQFGKPGDVPVPGNYLKDGRTYPAVYRDGEIHLQNHNTLDAGGGEARSLVNLPYHIRHFLY